MRVRPSSLLRLAIVLILAVYPLATSLIGTMSVNADTNPHVGFFSPPATWTAAGNANLALRQPDPRSGDLMVASISIRPAASTVNTPAGWTLLGSRTGTDGGAEGADTGSVGQYWFYKVSDGSEGTSNVTFTETGTTSVWIGSIMQVRSATGTYDLSLGGYSLNGDATNWGGTLDTNIGLTTGDLVLMAASTNGDLSASSAQNISATGVSTKSTVYEHGEYGSTTGNDIETVLSSTLIWSGTNTATPTLAHTLSVASSGTISALRIRQGSGTNRSDTWVRSAGPQVTGSTSLAVPYSEHEVGDVLILVVANRYETATPTTPAGWTSLGTYVGGAGTNGVDAGNARISAYYLEPASQTTGTRSVTITSANVSIGQMITVHKDDVDSWVTDIDGGTDTSPGTAWSVTGSGIDLASSYGGDIVLGLQSINTDAYLYSNYAMSASGITFGDVTQTAEFRSGTGNDATLAIATGRVSTGSGTVNPTMTATASGSATNAPAGSTMFVKIIGVPVAFGSLSVDIVDGAGASVAIPSVLFGGLSASASCQTSNGTFGTTSEKIRLINGTATPGWSLGAAATLGATANWSSGPATYDFNDSSGSGCTDGADADSLAGQLTISPSTATNTPQGGCSTTGISLGSPSGFNQGIVDSITLATASGAANTNCYWDFTDISLSQTIPSYQASGSYSIDITITSVAN